MTTLADIRVMVARALKDPENRTFDEDTLDDLINSGINEVSQLAPQRFVEDVTPTVGQYRYALISGTARAGTRATRVELWDVTLEPSRFLHRIAPANEAPLADSSENGYRVHNGELWLPSRFADSLDPDAYVIRVWGETPYLQLASPAAETDLSTAALWAVRERATLSGYEHLAAERALFKQWQAETHNTDVSFASLLNLITVWEQKWQRRRKQLLGME